MIITTTLLLRRFEYLLTIVFVKSIDVEFVDVDILTGFGVPIMYSGCISHATSA